MNILSKWSFISRCSVLIMSLALFSCQDMNKWDDPSGNQVYPQLEKLTGYTFEQNIDPNVIQLYTYDGGATPTQAKDNDLNSKVLILDGGYARIANPVPNVKIQNGISFTFWMKQVVEEGEEQDLTGALISFQNEEGTEKTFITANGWLSYSGAGGKYEDNNPAQNETGIISANEWHYVAITIRNNGYAIYVDGENKINKKVEDFDFATIVQSMASVPYIYIGYGAETETQNWMIDDLTIYRNQFGENQIKVPQIGSSDKIIVGNEDFSSEFWTAFSDQVVATGDKTIRFGFTNYNVGIEEQGNWYKNWVLILTNGKERSEAGYAEYFALRSDNWGWGPNFNQSNISFNYNWDTFVTDMNGAYVDMTIKRTGERVDVTAIITTARGSIYSYSFFCEGVTTTDIGAFLTVDHSYLEIDSEAVFVGDSYSAGSYIVGATDFSSPWWAAFSDYATTPSNITYPLGYTFKNHNNGIEDAAHWYKNWVLIVTNGKERGADGYAEYFVLRSDNWGWGANYNAANITLDYNWDTFMYDMNGADCKMLISRNKSGRVDLVVKITTLDEKEYNYTFYAEGIGMGEIGAFFVAEGSYMDIRSVGYYPFMNK